MKTLRLVRTGEADEATFGVLYVDGKPEFVTLEEPWRDNQKQISCIPEGNYQVDWRYSPKFGKTLQVVNVPNRSHILFHAGNGPGDTEGCILIGTHFGKLNGKSAILKSRPAFEQFVAMMQGDPDIELEIISIGRMH